jgi:hypothetical protein
LRNLFSTLRNKHHDVSKLNSNLKDEFENNFKKIFGYMANLEENQERIINFIHDRR